eukprot:TRINITY_DN9843_c0_g1_i1.p1 TRINITY_DN9843_c0_g1~~TRINITY_DN9843_c0_g1_i1.p1  ORF type:complete len:118 (-),score=12.16 TRINITY_DN9843_c0_g1_i1:44-397(-)
MVKWEEDANSIACQKCKRPFSVIRRKHHCRNCGHIFCDACSTMKTTLPNMNITGIVRVCDECFWISSVFHIAPQREKIIRITLIGERHSGKSSMIHRFIHENFARLDSTQGLSLIHI